MSRATLVISWTNDDDFNSTMRTFGNYHTRSNPRWLVNLEGWDIPSASERVFYNKLSGLGSYVSKRHLVQPKLVTATVSVPSTGNNASNYNKMLSSMKENGGIRFLVTKYIDGTNTQVAEYMKGGVLDDLATWRENDHTTTITIPVLFGDPYRYINGGTSEQRRL